MSIIEILFCVLAGGFISFCKVMSVNYFFLTSLMKFFLHSIRLMLKFFAAVYFHHIQICIPVVSVSLQNSYCLLVELK